MLRRTIRLLPIGEPTARLGSVEEIGDIGSAHSARRTQDGIHDHAVTGSGPVAQFEDDDGVLIERDLARARDQERRRG